MTETGARVQFALPDPFPLLNQLLRMHWRKRKDVQQLVAEQMSAATVGQRPVRPFRHSRVLIERHSPGSPDLDGLYGGAKLLIDCLSAPVYAPARRRGGKGRMRNPFGLSIVVDDGPDYIRLHVSPVRCGKFDGKTIVLVEQLTPAEFAASIPSIQRIEPPADLFDFSQVVS